MDRTVGVAVQTNGRTDTPEDAALDAADCIALPQEGPVTRRRALSASATLAAAKEMRKS